MNIFRQQRSPSVATCSSVAALLALLMLAGPASAQECIQDVWQAHGNNQSLTCTANDVTLSSVGNICILIDPGKPPTGDNCQQADPTLTCIAGQEFTFAADFTMPLTAQNRYDLGLYIASDGGGSDGALTGSCWDNVVTPANSPTYFASPTDRQNDVCGDISAETTPQVIRQTITAMCIDVAGSQPGVDLPWCTSWRQPGADELCDSTTYTTASAFDAFPGSPSKCNCGTLNIDVFTETADIEVTKDVAPTEVDETGGEVVYSVSVLNKARVASLTLDTLTDDIYGDITSINHGGITETTCSLVTIPAGNVAGNPYTCQFKVQMPAADTGDSVDDTVTACGTDSFGNTNRCDDDPAQVTYKDVATDPSLTKNAALHAVQVDVDFTVTVKNNSTVDTLTVDTLTDDKFGDITTIHPAAGLIGEVVATNCATGGVIASGGTYSCLFTGRIIETGLHVDVASGTAHDDDAVTYPRAGHMLNDNASVNISVTFP